MKRKPLLLALLAALVLSLGLGSLPSAVCNAAAEEKAAPTGEAKINKFKDGKLNLNAANREDLLKIDLIDEELADSILEMREENGEFVDMEELLDIDGIDNRLLRKLGKKIYLEPASDCNC